MVFLFVFPLFADPTNGTSVILSNYYTFLEEYSIAQKDLNTSQDDFRVWKD